MLASLLVLAAAAAAPPAAARPDPWAGAPNWVLKGSRSTGEGPERVFLGVGIASKVGLREEKNLSPAGAWLAFGRALAEVAKALDSSVQQLNKQLAEKPGEAPVGPPDPILKSSSTYSFGAVKVQSVGKSYVTATAGGGEEQRLSEAMRLTFRDLQLKSFLESHTSSSRPEADEELQHGTLELSATDTTALLDELAHAGVELSDSWTGPEGTLYVLVSVSMSAATAGSGPLSEKAKADAAKIANAFDEMDKDESARAGGGKKGDVAAPRPTPPEREPGRALSEVRVERAAGQLLVSAALGDPKAFAPTVFWRKAGADKYEAAALLPKGSRVAATLPVAADAVDYFVEAWDANGHRVSRVGSLAAPRKAAAAP